MYEYEFEDNMQAGRDRALARRNAGFASGQHKSWGPRREPRPEPDLSTLEGYWAIIEARCKFHICTIEGCPMTQKQYLTALKKLDLTPASKQTAEVLGLGIRQLIRIANGQSNVPEPVARLLKCLIAARAT